MDQWNPMEEHYLNPDNEPGRHGAGFQTRGGASAEKNKLYVKNIPKDTTEDGLCYLFTGAVGSKPISVSIPASRNPEHSTCIGFVTFSTAREASKAIEKLNRQDPLHLVVQYQVSKTERHNQWSSKQCPPVSPVVGAPYDAPAPIPHPRAGYLDPRGGASGELELTAESDAGIAINLNVCAGNDGRQVSLGRAYYPVPPGTPRAAPPSSTPASVRILAQKANASPQKANVSPREANSLPQGANLSPVVVAKELPLCESCLKPGPYICRLCEVSRYCSKDCADAHWAVHSTSCIDICKPPGLVPATAENTDVRALNSPRNVAPPSVVSPARVTQSGVTNPASPRPREISAITKEPQVLIDNYADLPEGVFTTVTMSEVFNGGYWVTVDSRDKDSCQLMDDLTKRANQLEKCVPGPGAYVAAAFGSDWYRARVVKPAPLTVFYVDCGLTEEVKIDDVRALPSEFTRHPAQAVKISLQEGSAAKYRNLELNAQINVKPVGKLGDCTIVQVQGDTAAANHVAPARVVAAPVTPAAPKTAPVVVAPVAVAPVAPVTAPAREIAFEGLPAGTFSEVTVVVKGERAVVVNLTSNADALADMFTCLRKEFQRMLPCAGPTAVAVGNTVAVLHVREVHRAQVVSIGGTSIGLHLIDDGKDIIVDAQKVRTLPSEFYELKAQAINIQLKEGTPQKNSDLLEGADICVKPVGKTSWGAWIVEVGMKELPCQKSVQPFVSDQATTVHFAFKEAGEKYIQTNESSEVLLGMMQELTQVSAELKPCTAKEGAFVAVPYAGEWSRGKIISVNPEVEVLFIDYGNKQTVNREDIRELPDKFTQIPAQAMKVFLSEETPAAVGELEEFISFKAKLLHQLQDGAMIIVGRLMK